MYVLYMFFWNKQTKKPCIFTINYLEFNIDVGGEGKQTDLKILACHFSKVAHMRNISYESMKCLLERLTFVSIIEMKCVWKVYAGTLNTDKIHWF